MAKVETRNTTPMSSISKGMHAELLAQTALLANGYVVMTPLAPEPFDLAVRRTDDKETFYIQVKTAFIRDEERYGGEYIVVRGSKNNGNVYTKDEVDFFIAVYNSECYMFSNREVSEYWCRPDDMENRWTKLKLEI